ncbi:MAG: ComF family protein [Chloroflexi bacterium]|nr:ComF family protein [Chloroflexota bacterium]
MAGLARIATEAQAWLLDLAFPPTCGNCGRVDFRFCHDCLGELGRVPVTATRREAGALDELCATGAHSGVLRAALQSFKYEGATLLAETLAARLTAALRQRGWRLDVIVPVPLFADREEERGYNQSALLSAPVAGATRLPCHADHIWRTRSTSQQAMLSELERRENVKDAFEASEDVKGLSVLLIDDVVTTGSTLAECASALRAMGASKVYGMAVSHA